MPTEPLVYTRTRNKEALPIKALNVASFSAVPSGGYVKYNTTIIARSGGVKLPPYGYISHYASATVRLSIAQVAGPIECDVTRTLELLVVFPQPTRPIEEGQYVTPVVNAHAVDFVKSACQNSDGKVNPEDFIPKGVRASMFDSPTPEFHRKVNKGEIFNKPVVNEKTTWDYDYWATVPTSSVEYTLSTGNQVNYSAASNTTSRAILDNLMPTPANPFCASDLLLVLNEQLGLECSDYLRNNVISDAYGKVNAGKFSYLVEALEGGETFTFLKKRITQLVLLLRDLKSGKWKRNAPLAYKKLKKRWKSLSPKQRKQYIISNFADAWMEARYAVRPLLISINDSIDLYNKGLGVARERFSERSFENLVIQGERIFEKEQPNGDIYRYNCAYSSEHTYTAGVLLEATSPNMYAQRQLGFTAIAISLMEVVPYSFVASWLLNWDGLLYKMSPNIGVNPLAAWSTFKRFTFVSGTVECVRDDVVIETLSFDIVNDSFDRKPETSPPLLNLDINLDIYKMIDISILIRQLSLKRPKVYHFNN